MTVFVLALATASAFSLNKITAEARKSEQHSVARNGSDNNGTHAVNITFPRNGSVSYDCTWHERSSGDVIHFGMQSYFCVNRNVARTIVSKPGWGEIDEVVDFANNTVYMRIQGKCESYDLPWYLRGLSLNKMMQSQWTPGYLTSAHMVGQWNRGGYSRGNGSHNATISKFEMVNPFHNGADYYMFRSVHGNSSNHTNFTANQLQFGPRTYLDAVASVIPNKGNSFANDLEHDIMGVVYANIAMSRPIYGGERPFHVSGCTNFTHMAKPNLHAVYHLIQ